MPRRSLPQFSLGFTRLGLLTSRRRDAAPRSRPVSSDLLALAAGSVLIGLGVGLYLHADLGLTPYDVFLSAITGHVGAVSHGQAGWIFAAVLFAVATALGRRPAVAGVALIVANGFTTDVFDQLLPDAGSLPLQLFHIGAGLAAMVLGISIVVHTSATGGPFELLMSASEDRGRSATATRTTLEIGCLVLGVVGGGDLGPATLFFGLLVGPAMSRTLVGLERLETRRERRSARVLIGAQPSA